MEDDPDGMPHAGANAAHTVTKIDAIITLRALDGAVMNCECHSITLPKRHDFGAALHARPLLREDELAAGKVFSGFREENRDLDRECEIAIKVLVETVEVVRDILQQKRRWLIWPA